MSYIVTYKGEVLKASVEESRPGFYKIVLGDKEHEIDFLEAQQNLYSLIIEGKSYEADVDACDDGVTIGVDVLGDRYRVEVVQETKRRLISKPSPGLAGRQEIKSPMAGNVWELLVRQDERVEAGQVLIILEAMKMENQIKAPVAGKVTSVSVLQGGRVAAGDPLCVVEPSA
jgi:acetyl/propionyl-CoA carboxylase alpha subunit